MTATNQLQVAQIPASIDNAADWNAFVQQIDSQAGVPTVVTPELIVGMLGSAVPLLFEADGARDANLLRGTFSDQVIAQCQRNLGSLQGQHPRSVIVHLIGAPRIEGHPVLRAHLSIQVQGPEGGEGVNRQYWDLQLGAEATVGQPSCPNCGAPVAAGHLICEHCGTDVRSIVEVPLVVSRLELY